MVISSVHAQCPVCVLTVGGGLFIAKKLGVDDVIAAIWISGLNTALSYWFAVHIKKPLVLKNPLIWTVIMFLGTYIYLSATKQLFHPNNTLFGIDKAVLGLLLGALTWILGIYLEKLLRTITNGKRLFPYQKVLVPFVALLLLTMGIGLAVKV